MSLTNRTKVVSNKRMSFLERLYLPAIFKGMVITMKHVFMKKVTIKYPEKTREFSEIYRGRHVLKRDDEGREDRRAEPGRGHKEPGRPPSIRRSASGP